MVCKGPHENLLKTWTEPGLCGPWWQYSQACKNTRISKFDNASLSMRDTSEYPAKWKSHLLR